MEIEVRCFARLADFLPPGTSGHAARVEVPSGSTVADLAERLAIPRAMPWFVLVNDRESEASRRLSPGDVVTLLPPLEGGAGR